MKIYNQKKSFSKHYRRAFERAAQRTACFAAFTTCDMSLSVVCLVIINAGDWVTITRW